MSTILSTAMFASFKSNGDSETEGSSPLIKRNFFARSSSQSSSESRSTMSTSSNSSTTSSYRGSRVAMGDLNKVRDDYDDLYYQNNHGLDIENWKSFHRRFGSKPKKPSRRRMVSSPPRVPFLRSQIRQTASRQDSTQETDNKTDPTLWKSVVHAVKGCTSPMWEEHASAPMRDDDDWLDEVPSHQRHGILDIRHENGKWHFLEDPSTTADDAVEYQLME